MKTIAQNVLILLLASAITANCALLWEFNTRLTAIETVLHIKDIANK